METKPMASNKVTKSQVPVFFNSWLTLMEKAYQDLSKKEFSDLENRIKTEISFHRRRKHGK